MRLTVGIGLHLGIEDDLNDAFAIAKIDEDDPAVVAAAVHPSHEDHFFSCVGSREMPAVMGSFDFGYKVGQGSTSLSCLTC
jgi:hypothetical protein